MQLKAADLLEAQRLGRLVEIRGELPDSLHVAANGIGAVVTQPEFLQHPSTKFAQRISFL